MMSKREQLLMMSKRERLLLFLSRMEEAKACSTALEAQSLWRR